MAVGLMVHRLITDDHLHAFWASTDPIPLLVRSCILSKLGVLRRMCFRRFRRRRPHRIALMLILIVQTRCIVHQNHGRFRDGGRCLPALSETRLEWRADHGSGTAPVVVRERRRIGARLDLSSWRAWHREMWAVHLFSGWKGVVDMTQNARGQRCFSLKNCITKGGRTVDNDHITGSRFGRLGNSIGSSRRPPQLFNGVIPADCCAAGEHRCPHSVRRFVVLTTIFMNRRTRSKFLLRGLKGVYGWRRREA